MLFLVLASAPVYAQNPPVDLSAMSVEQLISLRIGGRMGAFEQHSEDSSGKQWHVRYRFARVEYDGYLDGTTQISESDLLGPEYGYKAIPRAITHEVHALELGIGLKDDWVVFAHIPYLIQETPHKTLKDPFTIRTEGMGDVSVSMVGRVAGDSESNIRLLIGISLPTGSIDERGDTPAGKGAQVPYTMQLGSGTFDLSGGVSGQTLWRGLDLGAQVNGLVRLGHNARGYSLGNRFLAGVWIGRELTQYVKPSIKCMVHRWGDIDGHDRELPAAGQPALAPVADPENYGGTRVDVIGSLDVALPVADPGDYALAIELGIPIYQSLNGPQIEADSLLSLLWKMNF